MPKTRTSFQPGNLAAVKDGSRSPRTVQKNSRSVGRSLGRQLRSKSVEPLIELAVDVKSRRLLMSRWLDRASGRASASHAQYERYAGLELAIYAAIGIGRQRGAVAGTEGLASQLARRREELEQEQRNGS